MKKLLEAGKFKNLHDMVVGASVLNADGKVGTITSTSKKVWMNYDHGIESGDVAELKIDISYPSCGASFHTYRRDGRSQHDAEHDIVAVCRPEDSKVKQVKVYSDQPITKEMLDFGWSIAEQFKLHADTNKDFIECRDVEKDNMIATGKLTKSGLISIKVSINE